MGLPNRPLYRELATRLLRLSSMQTKDLLSETTQLVPAESLGMKELPQPTLPPPPKHATCSEFREWLYQAGDAGVCKVLGMRKTVGTNPKNLLPPSWSALVNAAAIPNSSNAKLSVAARARAKHAHRGQDQFFGLVKGSQEEQNAAAQNVIIYLLKNAVWINIHSFAGMDSVLEVRVASGYGARWKADWSNDSRCLASNVTFRGFLEPQMQNGHDKGWKH